MGHQAPWPSTSQPRATATLSQLAAAERWGEVAAALGGWVPVQRWFQGKARVVTGLRVVDAAVLPGTPPVLDLVLEVAYAGADAERYQVPLVTADGAGEHAATVDGVRLRDALAAPEACRVLAASALRLRRLPTIGGNHVNGLPVAGEASVPDGAVRPMGVEQTNSSVVIGDAVLKVFRKLEDGPNPDVELTRALTTASFAGVPAQRGAMVLGRAGVETTLAVLSDYAAGAEEGWALACEEAVAAARGREVDAFAASIGDLGSEIGHLHATLAATLGRHEAPPGAARTWASAMREQVRRVLAPAQPNGPAGPVLQRAEDLEERVAEVAALAEVGPLIRVHGDLHLGQVLYRRGRWLVLDFEGEPARPLAERRLPHSPLRDVASMLRSFDYAAAQADLDLPPALRAWRDRLREAFLEGYVDRARSSGLLPGEAAARVLLDAFELDKAVYELGYELANRPDWVAIPAGGILRLLDGKDDRG